MKGVPSLSHGNNPLIRVEAGDSPVVLSAPHGGRETPEELKRYVVDGVKGDVNTDCLLLEIAERCGALGMEPSIIIALFSRRVLDINWGKSGARGEPELLELYQCYYDSLRHLVETALAKYGFSVVLDVHGYDDGMRGPARHGFPQGALCLGTRCGELIAEGLLPAYESFRASLREAGLTIYPERGFDEYGPFIGGTVVCSLRDLRDTAAVQLETPLSIRVDERARQELAEAVAGALREFAATAEGIRRECNS